MKLRFINFSTKNLFAHSFPFSSYRLGCFILLAGISHRFQHLVPEKVDLDVDLVGLLLEEDEPFPEFSSITT